MSAVSPLGLSDMLTVKMEYDGERQKILAQNLASIDTPGYKAQELVPLDFGNVLKAQTQQVSMAVTNGLHMTGGLPYTQHFRSTAQRNTFERTPTGGTVVLEEQMMKVSENATDYTMTTDLYAKISNLFKEALGLQGSAT
jgi:flagellar basal-body rod protein FlgB